MKKHELLAKIEQYLATHAVPRAKGVALAVSRTTIRFVIVDNSRAIGTAMCYRLLSLDRKKEVNIRFDLLGFGGLAYNQDMEAIASKFRGKVKLFFLAE